MFEYQERTAELMKGTQKLMVRDASLGREGQASKGGGCAIDFFGVRESPQYPTPHHYGKPCIAMFLFPCYVS